MSEYFPKICPIDEEKEQIDWDGLIGVYDQKTLEEGMKEVPKGDHEIDQIFGEENSKKHWDQKVKTKASMRNINAVTLWKAVRAEWLKRLYLNNKGETELDVVSVAVFIYISPDVVQKQLIGRGVYKRNIGWIHDPKFAGAIDRVNKMTRAKMVENQKDDEMIALGIARMTKLIGRHVAEADYQEYAEGRTYAAAIRCLRRNGRTSPKLFLSKLKDALCYCISYLDIEPPKGIKAKTIKEWWSSRLDWARTGSTSESKETQEKMEKVFKNMKMDKTNKRGFYASLKYEDWISRVGRVPTYTGRLSTKNEPGGKDRILGAQDDISYPFAMFASNYIEAAMDGKGVMLRQTAEDVKEMNMYHKIGLGKMYWASLDYSNFNNQHSNFALALSDFAIAKLALKHYKQTGQEGVQQKIKSGLYNLYAHFNSYIKRGDEITKKDSGLLSGHRNTGRDNTLLHMAYNKVAEDYLVEEYGCIRRNCKTMICGDDEDRCCHDVFWLGLVYCMLKEIGFEMNDAKQIISKNNHIFIQYKFRGKRIPRAALAPMCTSLVAGNWYQTKGAPTIGAEHDLAMTGLEMIRRHGDCERVRRLIYYTCNTKMIKDGVKLEWWTLKSKEDDELFWRSGIAGEGTLKENIKNIRADKKQTERKIHVDQVQRENILGEILNVQIKKIIATTGRSNEKMFNEVRQKSGLVKDQITDQIVGSMKNKPEVVLLPKRKKNKICFGSEVKPNSNEETQKYWKRIHLPSDEKELTPLMIAAQQGIHSAVYETVGGLNWMIRSKMAHMMGECDIAKNIERERKIGKEEYTRKRVVTEKF
jgi:hypothetical protein